MQKIEHIDFTKMDVSDYVDSLEHTSFTSREIYNACQLYKQMIEDPNCTIILTIAGSTQAAGCLQLYRDLVKLNMVDVIVATGASVIDMDLYEALGYHHYEGNSDSHVKSILIGASETVIISNSQMILGTWQGVFLCDFDGPRTRNVHLKIIAD